jgi:hypothetical protein
MKINKKYKGSIISIWKFKDSALTSHNFDNEKSLIEFIGQDSIEKIKRVANENSSNNFTIYVNSEVKSDEIQSLIEKQNAEFIKNEIKNLKFEFFETKKREKWTFSGLIDSMKLEVINDLLKKNENVAFFDFDLFENKIEGREIVKDFIDEAQKSKFKRYFINDIYDPKSKEWSSNTCQFSPKILVFNSNEKNKSFIKDCLDLGEKLTIPRELKKGEKYFNIHFCVHLLVLKEHGSMNENSFNLTVNNYLKNTNTEEQLDSIEKKISESYLKIVDELDFTKNETEEFSIAYGGGSWAEKPNTNLNSANIKNNTQKSSINYGD